MTRLRPHVLGAWTTIAVLFCVGLGVSYTWAAQAGSIAGRVVDGAGQPVQGLELRLERVLPREPGQKQRKTEPAGRAVSDRSGRFAFENLAPGEYVVLAGAKDKGWIYMEVRVQAGDETDLGDLTLAKSQAAQQLGRFGFTPGG